VRLKDVVKEIINNRQLLLHAPKTVDILYTHNIPCGWLLVEGLANSQETCAMMEPCRLLESLEESTQALPTRQSVLPLHFEGHVSVAPSHVSGLGLAEDVTLDGSSLQSRLQWCYLQWKHFMTRPVFTIGNHIVVKVEAYIAQSLYRLLPLGITLL
jgi:hypothetical protein